MGELIPGNSDRKARQRNERQRLPLRASRAQFRLGHLEDCRTDLRSVPKKDAEVSYLPTDSHLALVEGCPGDICGLPLYAKINTALGSGKAFRQRITGTCRGSPGGV